MDENMSVALMYDELREQAMATFGEAEAKIIDKAFEIANAILLITAPKIAAPTPEERNIVTYSTIFSISIVLCFHSCHPYK